MQLDAQPQTNDLALSGSLSFTGSNPLFQMTPTLSNGVPVFPFLSVTGPVTFAGRFDLVCSFLPAAANFVLGPVTLLESGEQVIEDDTDAASPEGNQSEDERKVTPLDVKVGDRILFGKYSGSDIKLDGEEYMIMREDEVLGILEAAPKAAKKG